MVDILSRSKFKNMFLVVLPGKICQVITFIQMDTQAHKTCTVIGTNLNTCMNTVNVRVH